MKQEWPLVRLENLFTFVGGGTPARNNSSFYSGNIPWITVKDMRGDIIDFSELQITPEAISSSATNLIPAGTVIFATRVGLGKVGILSVDAAINQDLKAAIPRRNDIIPNYFLYWMKSNADVMVNAGVGATVKGVTLEFIRSLSLPLPPVDEQKQIVQIVSHVASQIELRKKQLAKLDLLAKSRFIEMFGDPELNTKKFSEEKLENLFRIGSSKRILQSEQVLQGVPFLRISDLMQRIEGKQNTVTLFVSEAMFAQLQKDGLVPKSGDILITSRGTLGRCYVIQPEDRFYFQDGMISWLSERNSAITNTYLVYLFQMPRFRKQMAKILAGSTVAYLSIAMLKKIQVPLPPLALQNEFAAFIEQLDKSKFTIRRSLEKLEMLYQALLQEYFG